MGSGQTRGATSHPPAGARGYPRARQLKAKLNAPSAPLEGGQIEGAHLAQRQTDPPEDRAER